MSIVNYSELVEGKGVYVGAGLDNNILDLNIKLLIAIDSRPVDESPPGEKPVMSMRRRCTRPGFLCQLKHAYNLKGFIFDYEDNINKCITFTNGDKTVRYYHSVAFPYDVSKTIWDDIRDYNFLICIGYMPHKCILDYSSSFSFIGHNYTCYLYTEKDVLELTDQLDWELLSDSSNVTSWILLVTTEYGKILDRRLLYGIEDYVTFSNLFFIM